jgi:hypothetical protein
MKLHSALLTAAILALQSIHSSAAMLYVNLNCTNPVPPYADWTTAATNIQDAIDVSTNGDLVLVTNGIYATGGRAVYGLSTNRVTIDRAITVESVSGPVSTIIQGSQVNVLFGIRCCYLTNGASLIGFTLTNGGTLGRTSDTSGENGGGVWCEDSDAVVSNCVFSANNAYLNGGGAYQGTLFNCVLANGSLSSSGGGGGAFQSILFDCMISNNVATSGGGVYNSILNNCGIIANRTLNGGGGGGAAYGTLSNCFIIKNSAPIYAGTSHGGGTYYSTLNNCVVSNNFAGYGGGVAFGVINNSLISSNTASSGGGAYSNTLVNCILKNNFAGGSGGGGGAYNSSLVNCTVVSNTAAFAPAGVAGGGVHGGIAMNCIIYYNYAAGTGSNYYSTNISYCCTWPSPTNGVGNITNDPVFANLAAGDFHLQSNSPCINSGNNSYVYVTTDLDGNPRIVGGTVDIGAYEYQSPSSILSYAWAQQYGLPTDGSADYIDSDGDGMNNWQEWVAGTDPTNALSVLEMLSPTPTNSPSGIVVTWQSVNTRTYYLQSSTNLGAQPAFSTIQSNIVGQAGTTSYTDTTATNNGPYFYRVGVQ